MQVIINILLWSSINCSLNYIRFKIYIYIYIEVEANSKFNVSDACSYWLVCKTYNLIYTCHWEIGERRGSLNWKQRNDIILGTARGLAYLHEEFHVCIIHRDIKTGNILLDDDLQPKIADFGLARLLPEDQTHLSTKFAGTL